MQRYEKKHKFAFINQIRNDYEKSNEIFRPAGPAAGSLGFGQLYKAVQLRNRSQRPAESPHLYAGQRSEGVHDRQ